jgi:isocitrate/isopropylmalate dehydrogenase
VCSFRLYKVADFWSYSLEKQANAIATATYDVLKEGKVKTADMGGTSPSPFPKHLPNTDQSTIPGNAKTTDVTKAIIDKL